MPVKWNRPDRRMIDEAVDRQKRRQKGGGGDREEISWFSITANHKVRILPPWAENGAISRLMFYHKGLPEEALPENWYSFRCLKQSYGKKEYSYCPFCAIMDFLKSEEMEHSMYGQFKSYVNLIDREEEFDKDGSVLVKIGSLPLSVSDWFMAQEQKALQFEQPSLVDPIEGIDIILSKYGKGKTGTSYESNTDTMGRSPLFRLKDTKELDERRVQEALEGLHNLDTLFGGMTHESVEQYFSSARVVLKIHGIETEEFDRAFTEYEKYYLSITKPSGNPGFHKAKEKEKIENSASDPAPMKNPDPVPPPAPVPPAPVPTPAPAPAQETTTGVDKVVCPFCSFSTPNQGELISHIATEHRPPAGDKPGRKRGPKSSPPTPTPAPETPPAPPASSAPPSSESQPKNSSSAPAPVTAFPCYGHYNWPDNQKVLPCIECVHEFKCKAQTQAQPN